MAIDPITPAHASTFIPQVAENARPADNGSRAAGASAELSPDQQREVEKLQQIDHAVRQHEQAHLAAGGQYVRGGPSYRFRTGPDGKRYAVAGEVMLETSAAAGHPEVTVRKMRQIRSAALAPADPSAQDRAVAAQATATESQAFAEQLKQVRDSGPGLKGPSASAYSAPEFARMAGGVNTTA